MYFHRCHWPRSNQQTLLIGSNQQTLPIASIHCTVEWAAWRRSTRKICPAALRSPAGLLPRSFSLPTKRNKSRRLRLAADHLRCCWLLRRSRLLATRGCCWASWNEVFIDLSRKFCCANSLVVLRFFRNVDICCFLLPKYLLKLVSDAFVFSD